MLTFRQAETRDIGAIMDLLGQVLLVHHNGRPDLFREQGSKYTPDELKDIFADENLPVFVCEDDGSVVAHCFCKIIDNPGSNATYPHRTLFIDDLCVDEKVRGKHVGSALYGYVKEWAASCGFYNITLHVWDCNPDALGFYRSLGMQYQQHTMESIL